MTATSQAVIVFRRPASAGMGNLRSFIVWIDGRRAGKVKREAPAEVAVEPGEHSVSVSMDWIRSQPFQVVVEPGSRTELVIGARSGIVWKQFVPIIVAVLLAQGLVETLRATTPLADVGGLPRTLLFIAVYGVLLGAYIWVAPLVVDDYWALFTLERAH